MNSILVLLAIVGAISARTISKTDLKVKRFPDKIKNGVNAPVNDFSFLGIFQATQWDEDDSFVVGTVIILSERLVLTAASGFSDRSDGSYPQVIVGSLNGIGGQVLNVYNTCPQSDNGLVLLKLEEDIVWNDNVKAAPMTRNIKDSPKAHTKGVVAGFGLALKTEDAPHLTSINVTLEEIVSNQTTTGTKIIRTKSNSEPTLLDSGSAFIVNGTVVGAYLGDLLLPSQSNSSTLDSFADLTSNEFWGWFQNVTKSGNDAFCN